MDDQEGIRDNEVAHWLLAWLRGYVSEHGLTAEETADCAQDLAISLCRDHFAAVRQCMTHTKPIAWLCRCADNACARAFQEHARAGRHHARSLDQTGEFEAGGAPEDAAPSLYAGLVRREARNALAHALNSLRLNERNLLVAHFGEQRTFVELAEQTGSTTDAVRMAVKRACKKVADHLLNHGFDVDEYLALMSAPPARASRRARPSEE